MPAFSGPDHNAAIQALPGMETFYKMLDPAYYQFSVRLGAKILLIWKGWTGNGKNRRNDHALSGEKQKEYIQKCWYRGSLLPLGASSVSVISALRKHAKAKRRQEAPWDQGSGRGRLIKERSNQEK